MTDDTNEKDRSELITNHNLSSNKIFQLNQLEDKKINSLDHLDGEHIKFHKSLSSSSDWIKALHFSIPQLRKLLPEEERDNKKRMKERTKGFIKNLQGMNGKRPLKDDDLKKMLESLNFPYSAEEEDENLPLTNKDLYKVIECSFSSDNTHAGFIYYLHFCWAKEHGCQLRPDMLWYTIVSNIAQLVLDSPDAFRHLFTDSSDKKQINLSDSMGTTRIDVEELTHALQKIIQNKEFMDTICETRFLSEPPLAKLALQMTFAYMGTPYFDYRTMCGIPFLDLKGEKNEWLKLYRTLFKLKSFKPKENPQIMNTYVTYLKKCQRVVGNILLYGFGDQIFEELSEISIESFVPYPYASPCEFFSDIFHYGKKCGSGHDPRIVEGWIRDLYLDLKEDIWRFPTHVNYVPWDHRPSKRMFIQMVGLAYSDITEDNLAIANYGFITYEILNSKIFNVFAQR